MFVDFIVRKFFSVSLLELDVVKVIEGIVGCDFFFMHRRCGLQINASFVYYGINWENNG